MAIGLSSEAATAAALDVALPGVRVTLTAGEGGRLEIATPVARAALRATGRTVEVDAAGAGASAAVLAGPTGSSVSLDAIVAAVSVDVGNTAAPGAAERPRPKPAKASLGRSAGDRSRSRKERREPVDSSRVASPNRAVELPPAASMRLPVATAPVAASTAASHAPRPSPVLAVDGAERSASSLLEAASDAGSSPAAPLALLVLAVALAISALPGAPTALRPLLLSSRPARPG